jgi:hypothetical protein
MSVEFVSRGFLIGTYAAGGDLRFEVALATHRTPTHPSQHGDLADVREGIGDRALKDLFGWESEFGVRSQAIIERSQGSEEARYLLLPRELSRVVPFVFTVRQAKRPIEKIADVRQDLARCARGWSGAELGEISGSSANRLSTAIGQSRNRVTEQGRSHP